MSRVTYKTTTTNNEGFQKTVMGMLKSMEMSSNICLDVMQTNDRKIVIQPMGEWHYEINFNAKNTADARKNQKVIIHETYHDNVYHVSLTPEQMEFLQWLEDRGLLSGEMRYDRIDDLEFEEI
jgi:hypothetical protein